MVTLFDNLENEYEISYEKDLSYKFELRNNGSNTSYKFDIPLTLFNESSLDPKNFLLFIDDKRNLYFIFMDKIIYKFDKSGDIIYSKDFPQRVGVHLQKADTFLYNLKCFVDKEENFYLIDWPYEDYISENHVYRFDKNGDYLGKPIRAKEGLGNHGIQTVYVDSEGNIYFLGYWFESFYEGKNYDPEIDITYIVKVDSLGEKLFWRKSYNLEELFKTYIEEDGPKVERITFKFLRRNKLTDEQEYNILEIDKEGNVLRVAIEEFKGYGVK